MNIQRISATQTYHLRQKILRPQFKVKTCGFPQDGNPSSAHFGAFADNKEIVGIVSVFLQDETEGKLLTTDSVNSWQIRAMATDESVRGKGYATALLKSVEAYISSYDYKGNKKQAKGCSTLIWCNARSGAVGFYEKEDYKIAGKEFEIEGVGAHFRMRKKLF